MASTLVASFARVRAKAGRACTCCLPAKHGKCSNRATLSHYSASTTAMVLSNPLPGATTRPPDTQQLPPSQPIIQQLQASIETVAPASSSEHPSSLPSPSASSCPQNMQQSSSGCIDPSLSLPWATNQQLASRPCSFSQCQSPSPPSLERESQLIGHLLQVPLLRRPLHGLQVLSGGAPCVNCYPGRRGNCANAAPPNVVIPSTSPFQPLLSMTQQSLHLPQLPLALSQSPLFSSQSPSPHALLVLSNSQPPSTGLPSTPPLAHTVSSLPTSPQPCNPSSHSQRPLAEPRQPLDLSLLSNSAPPVTPIRKRCTIEGCTALIAPSMWRIHMSLHASGALPGQVPAEWLLDQNLFVCPHCSQLVANTRQASHLQHCSQSLTNQIAHLQSSIAPEPQINQNLPTFEEVCQLHHPTLRFVPTKARPAFARALSTALKEVLRHNSEEAWLKLFMLPKCVLPSLKQRGDVNPHTSIESLCKMWLNIDLVTLWSMSLTRANLHSSSKNFGTSTHSQEISSAISLGRSGLMGKACRILLSSGIAPSNSTTLNLLQSKNPSCPQPMIPDIASNPVTLGPSFDILHILRSFTKGTSAGPSGLSIQHLLDAASVPLQTPICDSLKGVVNILASGKAPKSVSAFLSGGRLIALNKGKFSEG